MEREDLIVMLPDPCGKEDHARPYRPVTDAELAELVESMGYVRRPVCGECGGDKTICTSVQGCPQGEPGTEGGLCDCQHESPCPSCGSSGFGRLIPTSHEAVCTHGCGSLAWTLDELGKSLLHKHACPVAHACQTHPEGCPSVALDGIDVEELREGIEVHRKDYHSDPTLRLRYLTLARQILAALDQGTPRPAPRHRCGMAGFELVEDCPPRKTTDD